MQIPYISTSFLKGFNALVLSHKGSPARYYQAVGLVHEAAVQESLLIPFDKFVYLLEMAGRELRLPSIALHLARQQDMMILAPLGPVLGKCRHVSDAVAVILKYLDVLVKGYQVELRVESGVLAAEFRCELPQVAELTAFQDYALASAYRILSDLAGRSLPVRTCHFTRNERKDSVIREYSNYFGCPVEFGCHRLSLSVDASVLGRDMPVTMNQMAGRMRSLLSRSNENFVEQVKEVISLSLANGISDITDIASSMGYSARSLQRQLQENNTSFRALLDSVRFTLANEYLKNTYYRMTDISVMLGYSNLSAFSRSYQRWCGLSPMDARQRFLV